MPRVFVNFRKADDRVARDRVHRTLVTAFGADQIFKSGSSIPPGTDYAQILVRQAAGCEVMLVLIGPGWLEASGANGEPLLPREHDWVRREIAAAFSAGSHVIPVLLGDATMLPDPATLPTDIARLGMLQFIRIEDSRPEEGLERMLSALRVLLPALTEEASAAAPVAPIVQPTPAAPQQPTPGPAVPGPTQTAKANRGALAINVGGNMRTENSRFTGGNGRED